MVVVVGNRTLELELEMHFGMNYGRPQDVGTMEIIYMLGVDRVW